MTVLNAPMSSDVFDSKWNDFVSHIEAEYCPDFAEFDYETIRALLENVIDFSPISITTVYLDYVSSYKRSQMAKTVTEKQLRYFSTQLSEQTQGDVKPCIYYNIVDSALSFQIIGDLTDE